MARIRLAVACIILATVGCEPPQPPPVTTKAAYDPSAAAQAMLKEYDTNQNGTIEGAELDACPSLKSAVANFDTNKDKKVSLDELVARFEKYGRANAAATAITVRVLQDGKPLPEVTVVFTAEKCFAGSVQGGKAFTRGEGVAAPIRDDGVPGLSAGLFRVTVTGPGVAAEYGTQNLLGIEVTAGGGRDSTKAEVRLSSKPK